MDILDNSRIDVFYKFWLDMLDTSWLDISDTFQLDMFDTSRLDMLETSWLEIYDTSRLLRWCWILSDRDIVLYILHFLFLRKFCFNVRVHRRKNKGKWKNEEHQRCIQPKRRISWEIYQGKFCACWNNSAAFPMTMLFSMSLKYNDNILTRMFCKKCKINASLISLYMLTSIIPYIHLQEKFI